MGRERKPIPVSLLKAVGAAWSIENMKGHDAGERSVTYIGSRAGGYLDDGEARKIVDYYLDSAGGCWYQDLALLPSGRVVSMEVYLFGRELPRKRAKK